MPNLQETSKVTTDNERSADKLLIKALLPSALGIVICIILLCGTTFAWLNDSVQTGSSTLAAGNFAVSVSATNATQTGMQYNLEKDKTCSVTVNNTGSSKTGYAILTIYNETSFIKSYLIKFDDSKPGPVTVTITTPGTGSFSVGVTSYWGTNSLTYDELTDDINLAGIEMTPVEETTTPETTPDNPSESASETTADNNENENGGQ